MTYRLHLLIAFICYAVVIIGQDSLYFSPSYESDDYNIPLQIINAKDHFYLLRYNRKVHDFIIEKRIHSTARKTKFISLKLDEVNSHFFDYQKLDYLLTEKNGRLFFVFEKVLNHKRTLYLKTIDSSGHTDPFVVLSEIEANDYIKEFYHHFKITKDGKLLIISKTVHTNEIIRKTVSLFDFETQRRLWVKKIPDQNFTGSTQGFITTPSNDLLYLKRMYVGSKDTLNSEVKIRDSLLLCYIPQSEKEPIETGINSPKNCGIHDALILPYKDGVLFLACMYNRLSYNSEISKGFFYSEYFLGGLSLHSSLTPYDQTTEEKLTYYDGPRNDPGYKSFYLSNYIIDNDRLLCMFDRKYSNDADEILVLKSDLKTGKIEWMHSIPRKISSSSFSVTYKHIGSYAASYKSGDLNIYFLDHPANLKKNLLTTSNSKTKKIIGMADCNFVQVKVNDKGITKELKYYNSDHRLIPLMTNELAPDSRNIFFITNGSHEKFLFE